MGLDLTVPPLPENKEFSDIKFFDEKGNEVDSYKLIVGENYRVRVKVKNERYETEDEAACVNTENITITLYVNN